MSQDKLKKSIDDLISAIKHCFEKKLFFPGLILLYSGIDIMAWLNRPEYKNDSDRNDFIEWTEKYFRLELKNPCRAVDLYSARCGLVHSYVGESRLTRKGKAKRIIYAWGIAQPEALQYLIRKTGKSDVILHIDDLFNAFQLATDHFQRDLAKDPNKANVVYSRVKLKFYVELPPLQFIEDNNKKDK